MLFLTFVLAAVSALLTFVQGYRTNHIEIARRSKTVTWVVGLFIVACTVGMSVLQLRTSATLKGLSRTSIEFIYRFKSVPPKIPGQKSLTFYRAAVPHNNAAEDLHAVTHFRVINMQPGQAGSDAADVQAWQELVQTIATDRKKITSQNIPESSYFQFVDQTVNFTPADIDNMKTDHLRIYLTSAAWWNNAGGTSDKACDCRYLAGEFADQIDDTGDQRTMHTCPCSKEDF